MPKIYLKPGSPEYSDRSRKASDIPSCDMQGCIRDGEHKAPKHRGLNEYHYFCLDHVKEYNRAWNFFSGMADSEIQEHVLKSLYGDRPTWKARPDGTTADDALREQLFRQYHFSEGAGPNEHSHPQGAIANPAEIEAMATLGMDFSATFEEVKAQYKKLAKKFHPDMNQNDKMAEEKFKKINMAYTLIKVTYLGG